MGLWKYKFWKDEPKTLADLRQHQDSKLQEYYAAGKFWYTPASADGSPTLLISSDLKTDVKPAYIALAKPKDILDIFQGTYETVKPKSVKERLGLEAPSGVYEFTVDKAAHTVSPTSKKILEDLMKGKDFARDLWLCVKAANPKAISFGPDGALKPIGETKGIPVAFKVGAYSVTRMLAPEKGRSSPLKSPPMPGAWTYLDSPADKKPAFFTTKGGLKLTLDLEVSVTLTGAVVEKGIEDEMLAYFVEPVSEIAAKHGEELKEKLLEIDERAETEKPVVTPKGASKPKAEKEANAAIAEFEADFEKEVITTCEERWYALVKDKIDLKLYTWDTKVEMAKATITVGIGIAAAAAGGLTGVAAVLGLIGTIDSGLKLCRDIYRFNRNIVGLETELEADLTRTAARYVLDPVTKKPRKAAGAEEVGKAILEHLPIIGVAINDIFSPPGTKTTEALTKNLTAYKAKVTETLAPIEKLLKQVKPAMEEATASRVHLEGDEWDEIIKVHPQMAAFRKALLKSTTAAEDALDDLLVEIAGWGTPGKSAVVHGKKREYTQGIFAEFVERRDKTLPHFTALFALIKKGEPKEAEIIKAFMPLIDIVFTGADPEKLMENKWSNFATVASTTVQIAVDLAAAVKGQEPNAKLMKDAEMVTGLAKALREANDIAKSVGEILKGLQGG